MSINKLKDSIEAGRKGLNKGLSIGLPKLEKEICGLTTSTYYLIGGLTSSGKTSFLLNNFIYQPYITGQPIKFIYYSLEMAEEVLQAKLLALYIKDTYDKTLTTNQILSRGDKPLSDEDYDLVVKSYPWLNELMKHLVIYDKSLNANKMYAHLCSELEKYGKFIRTPTQTSYKKKNPNQLVLVITDHLGLLKGDGKSKKEEIDLFSSYLVTIKNRCGISIAALSQLNRQSSSMDRRKANFQEIQIDDFKNTGNPVEDSDVTLAIFNPYREKMADYNKYDITKLKDRFRALIILKNRYGNANVSLGLNFFGEIGRFTELPKGDEIGCYDDYIYLDKSVPKINNENKLKITL